MIKIIILNCQGISVVCSINAPLHLFGESILWQHLDREEKRNTLSNSVKEEWKNMRLGWFQAHFQVSEYLFVWLN